MWNQPKFDFRVGKLGNTPGEVTNESNNQPTEWRTPLEVCRKRLLIQEDVWILEFLVEAVLHLFHAADNPVEVAVPC